MFSERHAWAVPKAEDPIDHQVAEFAAFVEKHQYTADQLHAAYGMLMRVAESTDPKVQTLYSEMSRLAQSGFPVNRFAELVTLREEDEDVVPIGLAYIDRLPVPADVRASLRSIIEERRSGQLLVQVGGQLSSDFEIRYTGGTEDKQVTVAVLDVIEKAASAAAEGGGLMEFSFSPERN